MLLVSDVRAHLLGGSPLIERMMKASSISEDWKLGKFGPYTVLCCAHRSLQSTVVAQPRAKQSQALRQNVKTTAAMEIYQVADELSYITGVAGVCFAITLVVRTKSSWVTSGVIH